MKGRQRYAAGPSPIRGWLGTAQPAEPAGTQHLQATVDTGPSVKNAGRPRTATKRIHQDARALSERQDRLRTAYVGATQPCDPSGRPHPATNATAIYRPIGFVGLCPQPCQRRYEGPAARPLPALRMARLPAEIACGMPRWTTNSTRRAALAKTTGPYSKPSAHNRTKRADSARAVGPSLALGSY